MDPFVHLHVASGYSLQYGASLPHVLVERAAEQEMDTLALTDRDGTYGAVKHAQACRRAGIRPVLGVDLAVRPLTGPAAGPAAGPWPASAHPGPGWCVPRRPAAAAGHLPGPLRGVGRWRPGGLGGGVPAGVRGPAVR